MLTDQPLEEERLRLRYNELDDMAVTTASAFLGLTLGCARCHDHKFDAIPTRDYYRLQCAFTTTARDNVLLATRAEAARYRAAGGAVERAAQGGSGQAERLAGRAAEAAHRVAARREDRRPADQRRAEEAAQGAARLGGGEEARQEASRRRCRSPTPTIGSVFSDEQRQQWDALKGEVAAVAAERAAVAADGAGDHRHEGRAGADLAARPRRLLREEGAACSSAFSPC